MGKKILAAVVFLSLLLPAAAQVDSVALHYAGFITEDNLREHLTVLASDEYEGREVGTPGEKKAAAYIMGQFQRYGIPPIAGPGLMPDGYRQEFPVVLSHIGGIRMEVEGRPWTFMQDYFYFYESLPQDLKVAEVMLVTPLTAGGMRLGGGGKVTMLWDAAGKGQSASWLDMNELGKMVQGTGVEVLLIVDDGAGELMERFGPMMQRGRMRLGGQEKKGKRGSDGPQVMVITPRLGEAILAGAGLKKKKALKQAAEKRVILKVPVAFSGKSHDEQLTGQNVLAYLEGTDKKDELVVVTAHLDHVGVQDGEVYNGADDDGSGTVAVLGMAEAFAKAKADGHGPRRSMLFMTVSGEEKGLFGSQWYTEHPVFPLEATVADLNIDMIGRVDSTHEDNDRYVYVIGSKRLSSELGEIVERQNATYTQLELDYTFDADDDPNRFYYRSDHYNFAKHGIPVAFFFNGVHEDYHGPYDEVDKIRFDLLHRRALLVYYIAWELANREDRPVVDGE